MEKQIEILLLDNEKLQEENTELKEQIENLQEEITQLREEKRHLTSSNNAYKGQITMKVNKAVEHERWELEHKEKELQEKENILKEYNIDELEEKIKELKNSVKIITDLNEENKEIVQNVFEECKNKINEELTQEFERFSEKDNDSDKTCGYLIGINKSKKIIRENLKISNFELKEYNPKEFIEYLGNKTSALYKRRYRTLI